MEDARIADGPDAFVDLGASLHAAGPVDLSTPFPTYTVEHGDLLDAVAARFRVPPWALSDAEGPVWTPFEAPRSLFEGEVLAVLSFLRRMRFDADGEPLAESASDPEEADSERIDAPPPHPAFVEAFPSEFFRDEADEFAPFGSDEGWDARASLLRASRVLTSTTTLAEALDVLNGPAEAARMLEDPTADGDPFVIGAAFTLVWLTGRIDRRGASALLAAVERQIARFGPDPRLLRMRSDVAALPRCSD